MSPTDTSVETPGHEARVPGRAAPRPRGRPASPADGDATMGHGHARRGHGGLGGDADHSADRGLGRDTSVPRWRRRWWVPLPTGSRSPRCSGAPWDFRSRTRDRRRPQGAVRPDPRHLLPREFPEWCHGRRAHAELGVRGGPRGGWPIGTTRRRWCATCWSAADALDAHEERVVDEIVTELRRATASVPVTEVSATILRAVIESPSSTTASTRCRSRTIASSSNTASGWRRCSRPNAPGGSPKPCSTASSSTWSTAPSTRSTPSHVIPIIRPGDSCARRWWIRRPPRARSGLRRRLPRRCSAPSPRIRVSTPCSPRWSRVWSTASASRHESRNRSWRCASST